MGKIKPVKNCLLILAAYSRYREALIWSVNRFSDLYGSAVLVSSYLPFNETTYYTASMGDDLLIQLSAFKLINPYELVDIKLLTNNLENEYKHDNSYPETRPINLDPGYLNDHKFVLATTKDADHRLFLANNIYAESTLRYASGAWQTWPWTYANYARADHKEFLLLCRKKYLSILRETL